jgi:protein required for attachment to host cells
MRVRIVVADQSEARFYDTERLHGALQPAGQFSDPKARLPDRDLESDRPGRVFDHAPPSAGRRGVVGHHGTDGERSPRKHEAEKFARQIADQLETARREGQFDRLVLMAAPTFLGLLRKALSQPARAIISAEVHKDLVHQEASVVLEHLPREAFKILASTP